MNRMTIQELHKILTSLGVPDFYYNISGEGRDDERVCLFRDGTKWSVFYGERGHKTNLSQYETESDACEDALARIMKMCSY